MKSYSTIIMFGMLTLLLIGCAPTAPKRIVKEPELKRVFYLPAEIITVEENLVTIRVEKPTLFEGDVKLALQLAQGIIENSYLLEGKETKLNQSRARVIRIIGSDILLEILEDSNPFKPDDRVRIFLEKKIIAIKDFEVIMGRNKEVAKYVQEDVTTALVNSGQFNVVERFKLKSVLEELELSQSGMIDPNSSKQVGKLLGADIILIGTLAATGEKWNVNLRIVSTETGLITVAINKAAPLHELKAEAFREIKNIDASFEDETTDMAGWKVGKKIGHRTGKGGYQKVYIDDKQGANGTNRCIAMKFKLGSERINKKRDIQARIRNRLKRDLSGYSGIKFYIKGTEDITVRFHLTDGQRDSPMEENWFRIIPVTKNWKEVRIRFNSLSLHKGKAIRLGTNQIMQLNYVEKIEWIATEHYVKRGTEGIIWIDEISFY
jgi:TolB-like protein